MDIAVDNDRDGRMDDLNCDGRTDTEATALLIRLAEARFRLAERLFQRARLLRAGVDLRVVDARSQFLGALKTDAADSTDATAAAAAVPGRRPLRRPNA